MFLLTLPCVVVLAILSVAFLALFERNALSSFQLRVGPQNSILGGFMQSFADALKLLSKQGECAPLSVSSIFYFFSPSAMLLLSILFWWVFPSRFTIGNWTYSSIVLLFFFSISVYGVIVMGWYSNSNYAALGCVRSTVQSISYEIGLVFVVLCTILSHSELLFENWSLFPSIVWAGILFPVQLICLLFILSAESNRTPFDLSEGESELVSGFCVEYGGTGYTLVYLSENITLLFSSILISSFYFGNSMFGKIFALFLFIWIRSSLPRIRFDNIMSLFWQFLLPLLFPLFITPCLTSFFQNQNEVSCC